MPFPARKFTIRDILWATVAICLFVAWRVDVAKLQSRYKQRIWTAEHERDRARSTLRSIGDLRGDSLRAHTSTALRQLIHTAVRDGGTSPEKMKSLLARVDDLELNRLDYGMLSSRLITFNRPLLGKDEHITLRHLETLDLIRTVLESLHRDHLPTHSTRDGGPQIQSSRAP